MNTLSYFFFFFCIRFVVRKFKNSNHQVMLIIVSLQHILWRSKRMLHYSFITSAMGKSLKRDIFNYGPGNGYLGSNTDNHRQRSFCQWRHVVSNYSDWNCLRWNREGKSKSNTAVHNWANSFEVSNRIIEGKRNHCFEIYLWNTTGDGEHINHINAKWIKFRIDE